MLFTVAFRGGSLGFPSPPFTRCKFLITVFQRAACVCCEPAFELEQNNCKGTKRHFEHQKLRGWKKKLPSISLGSIPAPGQLILCFSRTHWMFPPPAATAEDKSHDLAPALGAEEFLSSFSDKSLPRMVGYRLFSWALCKVRLFSKGHPTVTLNRLNVGWETVALQTLQLVAV